MIPKVIHYCWFGNNVKPSYFFKCFTSWESSFPDFEFMEWNETNSDLSHPFLVRAVREEKWAFVSDYVRITKLNQYGGVYLDTDMLFVKSFDLNLLNYQFFLGMEDSKSLSAGIIGASQLNFYMQDILKHYDTVTFNSFEEILIPKVLNSVYLKYGNHSIVCGEFQKGLILPFWVFYSLPFKLKQFHWKQFLLQDSLAVHLWAGSWMDYSRIPLTSRLLTKIKYWVSKYYVPKSFLIYARSI
jgi:hypothetical protein